MATSSQHSYPKENNIVRRTILEQAYRAQVGHIGSALSITDILFTLYNQVLFLPAADAPERDYFILSKGHGALALYAALYHTQRLTASDLNTYCADLSQLGVHAQHSLPFVEFTTGSLGQGLSWATGLALAMKIKKSNQNVFVLLSDGECNEGAVWEAIMFAAQHRLNNLYAIVDIDQQQAFGYTKDVLNLSPFKSKWQAFRWDAHTINGHDPKKIIKTIKKASTIQKPHVLLAKTVFGAGVSFMESKIAWHYSPLSKELYEKAMAELAEAS